MKQSFTIAVFEGDGIGPEIMAPTLDILELLQNDTSKYRLNFKKVPAGANEYLKSGRALPDQSLEIAKSSDAILLAAMGLPNIRYEDGTEISPQIDLRKELVLFAGVRPVRVMTEAHSPLKIPQGKVIDFVLIRESTEGLFFTQGKGEVEENEARETLRITRNISEKLFNFAFKLADSKNIKSRKGELYAWIKQICLGRLPSLERFLKRRPKITLISQLHLHTSI